MYEIPSYESHSRTSLQKTHKSKSSLKKACGKISKIAKNSIPKPARGEKDDAYHALLDQSDAQQNSSEDKTSSTCSDDFKRDKTSSEASDDANRISNSSSDFEKPSKAAKKQKAKKLKPSKMFSKKTQIKESLITPDDSLFNALSASDALMEGGAEQEEPSQDASKAMDRI